MAHKDECILYFYSITYTLTYYYYYTINIKFYKLLTLHTAIQLFYTQFYLEYTIKISILVLKEKRKTIQSSSSSK